MSAPLSIVEAIKILEDRQKQKRPISLIYDDPVDIMGVVINSSLLQSPPASSKASFPKAEIWISDWSMPSDTSARVTLYGSTEVVRVAEEQIKFGDVLRFNRVSLGKNYTRKAIQFLRQWEDPEPGIGWFRLGHIDNQGAWINQEVSKRMPDTMITPTQQIKNLVQRFRKSQSANSHTALPPLPCTRRRLNEIQSGVGLLSNVAVRVSSYDNQITPKSTAGRNRKLNSLATQSSILFANISDDSGVAMTLVDPGSRFLAAIRTAKETGQLLMLTRMVTKKQSSIYGKALPSDDVVLFPTTSTVALLTKDENWNGKGEIASPSRGAETQAPKLTLISSILDISIRGSSLKDDKSLESTARFLKAALNKKGGYDAARIHLRSCNISTCRWEEGILAGPNIWKTLCGGINAGELRRNTTLCQHALSIVRALFSESILLRWTIETKHDCAKVVKVALPKL